MSTVSNKFFINAIDDGTTLHGSLNATKSLSQAWTGTAAVPDWTDAANQPIVYLTLISGNEYVQPDSYKWKCNGKEIVFDSSSPFEKVADYKPDGSSLAMPAIRIKSNLADNGNVDIDIISIEGDYEMAGAPVGFAASINVRITAVTSGGVFGIINFDGASTITEKGQKIRMFGTFYDGSGNEITSGYTADFYLNDESHLIKKTTPNDKYAEVSEGDIVDSAVIICKFVNLSNGAKYTAYETVDDQQDPEFMYIQYNGANGNAASLKKGESVTFNIWMGRTDDPAVESGWTFKMKVLDAEGKVNTSTLTGINAADESGWRLLSVSGGVANCVVSYDVVKGLGKYMTGLIIGEK